MTETVKIQKPATIPYLNYYCCFSYCVLCLYKLVLNTKNQYNVPKMRVDQCNTNYKLQDLDFKLRVFLKHEDGSMFSNFRLIKIQTNKNKNLTKLRLRG